MKTTIVTLEIETNVSLPVIREVLESAGVRRNIENRLFHTPSAPATANFKIVQAVALVVNATKPGGMATDPDPHSGPPVEELAHCNGDNHQPPNENDA